MKDEKPEVAASAPSQEQRVIIVIEDVGNDEINISIKFHPSLKNDGHIATAAELCATRIIQMLADEGTNEAVVVIGKS